MTAKTTNLVLKGIEQSFHTIAHDVRVIGILPHACQLSRCRLMQSAETSYDRWADVHVWLEERTLVTLMR
jgi:hypothetical protein